MKQIRKEAVLLDREYTGKECAALVIVCAVLFAIGYGLMVAMGGGLL